MAKKPELSVIIPARNEEHNIARAIEGVSSTLKRAGIAFDIIAVDDCSSDGTSRILDGLVAGKKKGMLTVVHRTDNPGFGNALRAGFSAARGKYLVPLMGDLSDDPKDIVKMLKVARDGCDVVIGSRFVSGSRLIGYPKAKFVANRLFNVLFAFLLGVPYKDLTNGFKLYRASILKRMRIESGEFDITVELPLKALLAGARFAEVPVSWHGRLSGSPKWRLARAGYLYWTRFIRTLLGG